MVAGGPVPCRTPVVKGHERESVLLLLAGSSSTLACLPTLVRWCACAMVLVVDFTHKNGETVALYEGMLLISRLRLRGLG